jgi:hypothetical protein
LSKIGLFNKIGSLGAITQISFRGRQIIKIFQLIVTFKVQTFKEIVTKIFKVTGIKVITLTDHIFQTEAIINQISIGHVLLTLVFHGFPDLLTHPLTFPILHDLTNTDFINSLVKHTKTHNLQLFNLAALTTILTYQKTDGADREFLPSPVPHHEANRGVGINNKKF